MESYASPASLQEALRPDAQNKSESSGFRGHFPTTRSAPLIRDVQDQITYNYSLSAPPRRRLLGAGQCRPRADSKPNTALAGERRPGPRCGRHPVHPCCVLTVEHCGLGAECTGRPDRLCGTNLSGDPPLFSASLHRTSHDRTRDTQRTRPQHPSPATAQPATNSPLPASAGISQ